MARARIRPYGSWASPWSAAGLSSASVGLGQIALDGQDLYWAESRPGEGGRTVVRRRDAGGRIDDLLPRPFGARSRVHEYGGGAFALCGGELVFVNDADQRLYSARPGAAPRPITRDGPWRYADLALDPARRLAFAVREDHGRPGEPENTLVAAALDRCEETRVVVRGRDFYSTPRLSPDGRHLAWLAWRHPHMPWDETELWVGEVGSGGAVRDSRLVAGGSGESIFQPEWSPGGRLHFVSDRSGWWNLYALDEAGAARPLRPMEAEFGLPQWAFGLSTYAFDTQSSLVCTYGRRGVWRLARLDLETGAWREIETPFVSFASVQAAHGRAYAVAASPTEPPALVEIDLEDGRVRRLVGSLALSVDETFVSEPEELEFRSEGGRIAYGFLYAPRNPDFEGPGGERPPLRLRIHGGPTGATDASLKPAIQFWTSRGFAVLDVNYAGSTGYGRAYRELLRGHWGVADVADCVHGALACAERGRADAARLTISGSSAGGFTTLAALTFHDAFRVGASHYGIGDLAALTRDTHKFESRYLDGLIAPWPEGEALYRERSPLFHVERLRRPVLFLQGLQDRVVPPEQASAMADALRRTGVPVALLTFPDEGHGFRNATNIRRALEAELLFFGRILGFEPADEIEPLAIDNLPPSPRR